MNSIRREVLNGLFVLLLSTLLSAAIAAFQVNFNLQLWVLIMMAIAIAVGGYVVFEFLLASEKGLKKTEKRELEWLKRVGNPARLELGLVERSAGTATIVKNIKTMKSGTDYMMMLYVDRGRAKPINTSVSDAARQQIFDALMEQLTRGIIREYKPVICYDHDVLANDQELRSGVLRVGEGPGTIARGIAEHCRLMLETKGCSLYVAPVVLRNSTVAFFRDRQSLPGNRYG